MHVQKGQKSTCTYSVASQAIHSIILQYHNIGFKERYIIQNVTPEQLIIKEIRTFKMYTSFCLCVPCHCANEAANIVICLEQRKF